MGMPGPDDKEYWLLKSLDPNAARKIDASWGWAYVIFAVGAIVFFGHDIANGIVQVIVHAQTGESYQSISARQR